MIKLEIEEFLFEIKDEILSYEELGEEKALEWEDNFKKWLNNKNLKKDNIKYQKDKIFYLLEDETQIFDIAYAYYIAVTENKEKDYWQNFK